MQGLITIMYLLTVTSGFNSPINAHSDILPETVVMAEKYDHKSVNHEYVLPEVVVVADRYVPNKTVKPAQVKTVARKNGMNKVLNLTLNLKPNFAYAAPTTMTTYDVDVPISKTCSGNCNIAAGDTLEEDMTVTNGNAQIDGVLDGDLAVMGGTAKINGKVDGDVAVFGGDLDIMGTISGDAAVFGGQVHNNSSGNIEGDLAVIGGTVELDSGSTVKGDINMVGGTVDRDTNALVLGKIEAVEMKALERLLPRISQLGRTFKWSDRIPGSGAIPGFVGLAILLVAYILELLVLLIFPQSIDKIMEKIQLYTWAAVGFGLGIQILLVPIIILFAVSIIGIPLIPVFLLGILVAAWFGSASLSIIIGEKITKGFTWHINNRVGIFTIGWFAIRFIMILGLILAIFGLPVPPIFVIGLTIIYVAITIGTGGVIYALIKRERKTNNV